MNQDPFFGSRMDTYSLTVEHANRKSASFGIVESLLPSISTNQNKNQYNESHLNHNFLPLIYILAQILNNTIFFSQIKN